MMCCAPPPPDQPAETAESEIRRALLTAFCSSDGLITPRSDHIASSNIVFTAVRQLCHRTDRLRCSGLWTIDNWRRLRAHSDLGMHREPIWLRATALGAWHPNELTSQSNELIYRRPSRSQCARRGEADLRLPFRSRESGRAGSNTVCEAVGSDTIAAARGVA